MPTIKITMRPSSSIRLKMLNVRVQLASCLVSNLAFLSILCCKWRDWTTHPVAHNYVPGYDRIYRPHSPVPHGGPPKGKTRFGSDGWRFEMWV